MKVIDNLEEEIINEQSSSFESEDEDSISESQSSFQSSDSEHFGNLNSQKNYHESYFNNIASSKKLHSEKISSSLYDSSSRKISGFNNNSSKRNSKDSKKIFGNTTSVIKKGKEEKNIFTEEISTFIKKKSVRNSNFNKKNNLFPKLKSSFKSPKEENDLNISESSRSSNSQLSKVTAKTQKKRKKLEQMKNSFYFSADKSVQASKYMLSKISPRNEYSYESSNDIANSIKGYNVPQLNIESNDHSPTIRNEYYIKSTFHNEKEILKRGLASDRNKELLRSNLTFDEIDSIMEKKLKNENIRNLKTESNENTISVNNEDSSPVNLNSSKNQYYKKKEKLDSRKSMMKKKDLKYDGFNLNDIQKSVMTYLSDSSKFSRDLQSETSKSKPVSKGSTGYRFSTFQSNILGNEKNQRNDDISLKSNVKSRFSKVRNSMKFIRNSLIDIDREDNENDPLKSKRESFRNEENIENDNESVIIEVEKEIKDEKCVSEVFLNINLEKIESLPVIITTEIDNQQKVIIIPGLFKCEIFEKLDFQKIQINSSLLSLLISFKHFYLIEIFTLESSYNEILYIQEMIIPIKPIFQNIILDDIFQTSRIFSKIDYSNYKLNFQKIEQSSISSINYLDHRTSIFNFLKEEKNQDDHIKEESIANLSKDLNSSKIISSNGSSFFDVIKPKKNFSKRNSKAVYNKPQNNRDNNLVIPKKEAIKRRKSSLRPKNEPKVLDQLQLDAKTLLDEEIEGFDSIIAMRKRIAKKIKFLSDNSIIQKKDEIHIKEYEEHVSQADNIHDQIENQISDNIDSIKELNRKGLTNFKMLEKYLRFSNQFFKPQMALRASEDEDSDEETSHKHLSVRYFEEFDPEFEISKLRKLHFQKESKTMKELYLESLKKHIEILYQSNLLGELDNLEKSLDSYFNEFLGSRSRKTTIIQGNQRK